MTRYLNRFSRDYRYIRKVLTKEKKLLKVHKLVPIVNRLINNSVNYPLFVFFIFIFFFFTGKARSTNGDATWYESNVAANEFSEKRVRFDR